MGANMATGVPMTYKEFEMQAALLADNAACIQEDVESGDFEKSDLLNRLATLRADFESLEAYVQKEM